jgi:hypothetical protein
MRIAISRDWSNRKEENAMNLSPMIAGTTGGLLLAGLAIAQSPSPTPPAPSQPLIAQSAPGAAMARHTMEGQVTSVNPDKGRLYVKTTEGRMLHFPTSALQSVRKGDSVTIELAMKDNGPALKMMK